MDEVVPEQTCLGYWLKATHVVAESRFDSVTLTMLHSLEVARTELRHDYSSADWALILLSLSRNPWFRRVTLWTLNRKWNHFQVSNTKDKIVL